MSKVTVTGVRFKPTIDRLESMIKQCGDLQKKLGFATVGSSHLFAIRSHLQGQLRDLKAMQKIMQNRKIEVRRVNR